MILDKVFNGILDQGAGCLIVFDEPEVDVRFRPRLALLSLLRFRRAPSRRLHGSGRHADSRWDSLSQKTYDDTLETIGHVSQVVEQLFQRTRTAVI